MLAAIEHYITSNLVMLAELIALLILTGSGVQVKKQTLVVTRLAVLLVFLGSVIHAAEFVLRDGDVLNVWRVILSYANYALQPFIILVISHVTAPIRKKHLWLLIPLVLNMTLCFTSQWTHLVVWYTQDNSYQGGPLQFLPYFTFIFYLLVFVVRNLRNLRKYSMADRLVLIAIVLLPVAAVAVCFFTDITDDYSPIFASSILFCYLFFYIQLTKKDSLTGVMNRQCFVRDIDQSWQRITAVASVDMNGLKYLNDNFGHEAGDIGIRTIAEALGINTGSYKQVYRVGGDEFGILYFEKTREDIEKDIGEMRAKLAETNYSCAFGFAMSEGLTSEDAMRLADHAMYEDKARIKSLEK